MPRYRKKRFRKRRFRRRRYAKRRRRGKRSVRIGRRTLRLKTIVPDRMMLTFKTNVNFYVTANLQQTIVFHSNSMKEVAPDTGLGEQAIGWDQWKAFYSFYTVHYVKYVCKFYNRSSVNAIDIITLFTPSTMISGSTATSRWQEMPYSQSLFIPFTGAGSTIRVRKRYMSIKKVQGEKITDQEQYQSSVSSSPTKLSFFYIHFQDSLNAAAAMDCEVNVQIFQYVEMWQRVNLAQSQLG